MSRFRSDAAILLSAGALEAVRLHVLASLFFLVPGAFVFPLIEATLSLFAAILLSALLRGLGGRIVYRLFVHAAGLGLSLVILLAAYRGLPFGSVERLARLGMAAFGLLTTPMDWFAFTLVVAWGTIFWIRGYVIGRRTPAHAETVVRFDTGVGFLIFVFFIGLGANIKNPVAEALIPAYFLAAIFALAASRSGSNRRGGLPARSGFMLLIPFAVLFILAGVLTFSMFPDLFGMAADASEALGGIADRISPYFIAFIKFIFGFWAPASNRTSQDLPGPKESGIAAVHEPGFFERVLAKILGWGILGMLGLVLTLLIGYALWRLVRYLLARKKRDSEAFTFKEILNALSKFLRKLFARFLGLFTRGGPVRRYRGLKTSDAYFAMLSWGGFGGVSRRPCETPREYAARLAGVFPAVAERAGLVAELLERELYGFMPPSAEEIGKLKKARRSFGGLSLIRIRLGNRFGLPSGF